MFQFLHNVCELISPIVSLSAIDFSQWRIQGRGPPSPLFFDQNEARRAEKNFLGDRAPPSPRVWMPAPPPPPHLIWRSGSATVSWAASVFSRVFIVTHAPLVALAFGRPRNIPPRAEKNHHLCYPRNLKAKFPVECVHLSKLMGWQVTRPRNVRNESVSGAPCWYFRVFPSPLPCEETTLL